MKKSILLFVGILCGFTLLAQLRAPLPESLSRMGVKKMAAGEIPPELAQAVGRYTCAALSIGEAIVGGTQYDLQTNSTMANRIYRYPDGTIGATWTMGLTATAYPDRGTGYNYYDGADWGVIPTQRIESMRSGWPSYAPLGENGEIVLCHDFSASTPGIVYNIRPQKGSGDWTESTFSGPPGHIDLAWPRMTTSGPDRNTVHQIAVTKSEANGGTPYQGLDGALLYSRSDDAGQSWTVENEILPGLDATAYVGIPADAYAFADPVDDHVAFILADNWMDLVMMKSDDGGENWTKTVIWEHPYPLWNGAPTDTFYCPDGAAHIALGPDGKAHVAFGLTRAVADADGSYYFPFVDGVAYWNEDKPLWSGGDLNALDPELLDQSGSLVGWSPDTDGNDQLDFVGYETANLGTYFLGLSSMPQLMVSPDNQVILVYSSVTEHFDNGEQQYRHIWARSSIYGGDEWGDLIDLNDDIVHMFDECVFPTLAPATTDYMYLLYQADEEPGLSIRGDEDDYTDNIMYVMDKWIGIDGVNATNSVTWELHGAFPNPFSNITTIRLDLEVGQSVHIEVFDNQGQLVYKASHLHLHPGLHNLKIALPGLSAGAYICKITGVNRHESMLILRN